MDSGCINRMDGMDTRNHRWDGRAGQLVPAANLCLSAVSITVAQVTGQAWLQMPLYLLGWLIWILLAASLRSRRDRSRPLVSRKGIQELAALAEARG